MKSKTLILGVSGALTAVGLSAAIATTGQSAPSPVVERIATFSALRGAATDDPAVQRFRRQATPVPFSSESLFPEGAVITGVSVAQSGLTFGLTTDGSAVCLDQVLKGAPAGYTCAPLPINPETPPLFFGSDAQGNYAVTFAPDVVMSVSARLGNGKAASARLSQNVGVVRFGSVTPEQIVWSKVDGSSSTFAVPKDIFAPATP